MNKIISNKKRELCEYDRVTIFFFKMESLREWGLSNGAQLSNITFNDRTLTSATSIRKDATIFSTPLCLSIPETLCRASLSGLLLTKQLELTASPSWNKKADDPIVLGVLYMIAFLMHQKQLGKDSFFYSYLDSLPKR